MLLEIVETVARVTTSVKQARSSDDRGRRTDGRDRHGTCVERNQQVQELALRWLLLPAITAWQHEERDILRIDVRENTRRLDGHAAHRLNR